jgi:hypothetical protein
MRTLVASIALMLAGAALAQENSPAQEDASEAPVAKADGDSGASAVKTMSGMSILGNEEAPKSLVIVPWKSSQLGDGLGISNALDQSPRAVDKEVFMRELHFHELRSADSE